MTNNIGPKYDNGYFTKMEMYLLNSIKDVIFADYK